MDGQEGDPDGHSCCLVNWSPGFWVRGFTFVSKVLKLWCCDLHQYHLFHTTLGVDFKGRSKIQIKNMAAAIKQSLLSGSCRKMITQMTVLGTWFLYCAHNCLVESYKQNVEAIELAQSKTYSMDTPVPASYHYMEDLLIDCIVLGCVIMPSSGSRPILISSHNSVAYS